MRLLLCVLPLALIAAACAAPTDSQTDDSESAVSSGEQALTTNEKTAFQYFVGKGLTDVQAAGIVGNLIQESSVIPTAVEPGGPGRGIAQWSTGGRWNSLSHDNVSWYAATYGGSTTSLTTQLGFIWYELENFSAYGLSHLKGATTVTSAVLAFQDYYEVCGACAQSNRVKYAEQVLAAYGGSGGSTSSSSSSSSGGGGTCYSSTLGKTMPENACVQSRADSKWYQCDSGSWVDRYSDPTACNGQYPL